MLMIHWLKEGPKKTHTNEPFPITLFMESSIKQAHVQLNTHFFTRMTDLYKGNDKIPFDDKKKPSKIWKAFYRNICKPNSVPLPDKQEGR